MRQGNNQLILLEDDYKVMKSLLYNRYRRTLFDWRNAEELNAELKKARVVSLEEFPQDVVRLNSIIRVQTEDQAEVMEITLVTPDKADIKERKISIMAPIGMALIGFRKGQKVKWKVPSGKKTFTIIDVINDLETKKQVV